MDAGRDASAQVFLVGVDHVIGDAGSGGDGQDILTGDPFLGGDHGCQAVFSQGYRGLVRIGDWYGDLFSQFDEPVGVVEPGDQFRRAVAGGGEDGGADLFLCGQVVFQDLPAEFPEGFEVDQCVPVEQGYLLEGISVIDDKVHDGKIGVVLMKSEYTVFLIFEF